MNAWVEFLIRHSYPILFFWVFVEQLGLPLPGLPLLLAAGALAGSGQLNLTAAVAVPVLACVCSDFLWFQVGRHRGSVVLGSICPHFSRARFLRTTNRGSFSAPRCKISPDREIHSGLNLAAAPLAGIFRMRLRRFLPFDVVGALFWAGGYVAAGFVFSKQIEMVAHYALRARRVAADPSPRRAHSHIRF